MVVSTSAANRAAIPECAARLLRALPEAAMFISADGQIHLVNSAARVHFAHVCDDPTSRQLAMLVQEPEGKLAETLQAWSRSTHPTPGSFSLKTAEKATTFNAQGSIILTGSEDTPPILMVRFWLRAAANPFVLLNQKLAQLNDEVARRRNVEEALRRSELALRERAQEAEALNQAKDQFLATVSHELRTPLNAILGWSSLMHGRASDDRMSKALEVIRRNAEAQAKIIDDILDVSRIISGKLRLEVQSANLAAIVDEAVEVMRASAAAKDIEIVLVHLPGTYSLMADPDRLRQAVWNLLSNAVKFTDHGGKVRIEIAQRGSCLGLTVCDTGKGIEPGFLPFVFDRFKQADSSTTRRTGGLGLGLALVRHIVELHGGSVAAASEGPGKGASFTLTLPVRAVVTPLVSVAPGPRAMHELESRPAKGEMLHNVKILVVEDEPDARDLLCAALTTAGAEIASAGTAREAYELLKGFRPHVIVSDIGLPEEDGYSFMAGLRRLASDHGSTTIPSVALTAYTREEDRAKAIAAGFTTHMGKPVRPDDLVSTLATLAGKSHR